MDDSEGLVCTLEAENEVKGWIFSKKPTLVVRCNEHKIEAYIITGMASSVELYGHQVRVRIDDNSPLKERWSDSTDNEGLFSRNPSDLLKRLATAKTMLFEFTPFNASPVTIVFDVRGFEEYATELARVCSRGGRSRKPK